MDLAEVLVGALVVVGAAERIRILEALEARVDLLQVEARRESIDAGRVSCPQPFETEHRAAALWRDHARRSGALDSLDRADRAADSLTRTAVGEDQTALAALDAALALILRFDLCGEPDRLQQAMAALTRAGRPRRHRIASDLAVVHARIKARQARLSGLVTDLMDASALMDAALHGAGGDDVELRMDRAVLALDAGVVQRDARLLDQAGRDLGALVEAASPDHRPLTRARALALCGAGLSALAAVAGHAEAHAQGRTMFDAAADQFTPDHSPLDWAAIQVVRAGEEALPLMILSQAEALTQGQGLVIGALAATGTKAEAVTSKKDKTPEDALLGLSLKCADGGAFAFQPEKNGDLTANEDATAAGVLFWMLTERALGHKPSLLGACSGAIAGLVAVTPAAGNSGPFGAILLGAIAGVACCWFVMKIKPKLGFDDSLDVFGIHGVGGIVGALLTGVFNAQVFGGPGLAEPGMIAHQLWVQLEGVLLTVVWSGVVAWIAYKIANALCGMRVPEDQEREGLDVTSHGESAYHS